MRKFLREGTERRVLPHLLPSVQALCESRSDKPPPIPETKPLEVLPPAASAEIVCRRIWFDCPPAATSQPLQHEVDRENAGFLAESVLSIGMVKIGAGERDRTYTMQLPTGEGRGFINHDTKGDPEVIAWGKSGRVTRVYSCKVRTDRAAVPASRQVFCYDWAEIPALELGLTSRKAQVKPLDLFKKAGALRTIYVPMGRVRPVPTTDDED
jgi:hypothetical protein